MKKSQSIKFSIMLTEIFIVLLVTLAAALPFLVTWYVNYFGRHESLATTIMVTCYPCAPFVGLALFYLRRLLKKIDKGNFNDPNNAKCLKYIVICCIIIAGITLVAGRFYIPFFLVAGMFLFLALIVLAFRNIFLKAFK